MAMVDGKFAPSKMVMCKIIGDQLLYYRVYGYNIQRYNVKGIRARVSVL